MCSVAKHFHHVLHRGGSLKSLRNRVMKFRSVFRKMSRLTDRTDGSEETEKLVKEIIL